MKNFGETIRELRVAQGMGLCGTASALGIAPTYLSRIERGKEKPPESELVRAFARLLAADPDVLLHLATAKDPEVVEYIKDTAEAELLVGFLKANQFTGEEIEKLTQYAESMREATPPTHFIVRG
jgi:HTH-type transcriptional regulator, competence development regulator